MDNPIEELACVVLSVTEPSSAEVFRNIDKYFTEDVALFYPIFNQIYNRNGRENLKAAYQWRKTFTFNSKIKFNAIMVSKDQTQATLDITSTFRLRLLPIKAFDPQINFIIRVGLRKCPCDGKYRIYRYVVLFSLSFLQNRASGITLPDDRYANCLSRSACYTCPQVNKTIFHPISPSQVYLYRNLSGS
ncbi:hypothetical protein MJO29_013528 [Puccinia striiformis f. sp. tritici]|uniref:SigF-like NTF2-like domain-containing protein n=1 Tax=Puccinia striiformis TaxID=27350 RepID=A0A2S4V6D0_9BASI|nr:hypothetical protein MJO29_013528 [Puccinia striiformis f. sp. tritici]POW05096.1 hypothetical protein PSHT_10936 [Puccinia striiformis]